jgi:predicted alpha/beta superfamily hydrolase
MKSIFSISFILLILISSSKISAQELMIDSLMYKDSYKKIRLLGIDANADIAVSKQPILFIMDAQNLFDNATSYSGEWQVDETIATLERSKRPIVIGIDHGNSERITELTPYSHPKYGGGDADYLLNWMDQKLIPYLKNKYHLDVTESPRAIAGSSLGGLFSHYALVKRPDLFSYAGVLSPSYWYSDEIYNESRSMSSDIPRAFFLSGGTDEDENMVPDLLKMKELLSNIPQTVVGYKVIEEAQHNEAQWRMSFPIFLNWWLAQIATGLRQ